MKKISQIIFVLFVINLSFSQSSPTCAGANPICSGGVAPFPNTTGAASLGSPGCLGSAPNPAWFYFQIGTPGNLDILLHQGSNAPNYNNQDVDFICWGPFSSPQCTGLYDFPSTTIANNIVDCSYSGNATETINVTNAQTGQYYMLLVTNFSNNPGFIQMDLLSSSTATTNCNIVCGVTLGVDLMLCNSTSTKNLTATFVTAPTTGGTPTFQWFLNGVLQPALTTQTVTVNQPGTWKVITTRPGCTAPVSDEVVITNFAGLPINNTPPPITICTGASPALYNLNSNIPSIMGTQSIGDYDYGFYLTAADALAGTNPIPSSQWSAYPGTVGQTIYFGAENFTDGTGCRGEVHFLLQQSPCTIVQPSNMVVCDDVSNDGFAVFNLTTQTATVLGSNNPANFTITYHLTQAAANGDTGAISPATAFTNTVNPQTIYVRSESNSNPTNYSTTTFELQVKPLPTATMSGTASICSGSSTNLTFSGTPGAVVTYNNGTANQTVTLDATTGNGTVSVSPASTTTYSLVSVATTGTPSCSKPLTGNIVVTVSTQIAGTLSYSPSSFCTTDVATYSPTFVISTAGTGTCASTVPVYSSTPAGLTLNTTTGVITPSTSTPNTYTVTITYPACGSCAAVSFTTTVTIASPTTSTISYTTPLCTSATTSVMPTLTGATGATTFTSTPVGLSINATTGAINPSTSAAGTYTITYVPTSTGVCAIIPTPTTVTITAAPTASISYAGTPYCNNITASQAVTITGTNAFTGGAYSASPAGLTLDPTTGAIVPSTSTPNTYTVTYTIPASAGCAAVPVTTTVTITGLPTASISYAGTPYCNNLTASQAITITGTNAFTGGTYSATPAGLTLDPTTGAIVPSTSTPNTYTVTYTIPASAGCAAVPVTTTVTITAAPTASISYAGTPYCNNITASQAVTITGTNAFTGGAYSASPAGLTLDPTTGAIVPSTSTPNTYTVTYTIPASAGCAAVPVTTTVTITGVPTASISYAGTPYCNNLTASQAITITGTNAFTGGTYSATPSGLTLDPTTGAIVPSTSTPNTYTVTYTIPASAGCAAVPVTTTVTITAAPTASISYAGTPYCNNITASQAVTITGTNAFTGGAYSASPAGLTLDPTTGAIVPSTSTPNTYTVTYTIPASAGCAAVPVTTTVTITGLPTASISYAGTPYCNNLTASQAITITGTNAFTGGTYSATPAGLTLDPTTGAIVPSTSTPNTYTVTYTIPASAGCAAVPVTTTVTITAAPTASISYAGTPYCNNITASQAVTITGTNAFTGGAYSASPAGLTLDPTTGAIVPSTSTPNTYTVTYTIPASAGCAAVPVTTTVTITGLPTASISYAGTPYCNNLTASQAVTITGTNAFTGGTYSASPSGLTLDASTGAIVPSTSTPNTYTVTYTIPASAGCAAVPVTTTVTITAAPTASISYVGTPYCNNLTASQAVTITGTNAFTGGAYSASPSGLTLDPTTGAIVPSTSTPNTYTVTYTIPASAGCAAVPVTTTVTITGLPTASISYAGTPYCNNLTASQAVTITGTNAFTGGTYSATPSGLTLDASTGAIVPSTSTPNTYTVTYTIPASAGCAAVPVTTTVTITSLPTASISVTPTTICSGSTSVVTFTGTPGATVTYTVDAGANQTITLNTSGSATVTTPPLVNASVYTLVSVGNGCTVSLTNSVTINVLPLPTASIVGSTICANTTGTVTISGTPGAIVEYTIDGGANQTAILSSTTGTVTLTTPLLTANSVYQLVSVTSATTPACVKTLSASATVIVNPIPIVTATLVGETICSGTSTNISLTSSVASTQFDWVVTSQVGVSGATNGSGNAIVQVLTATGITNGFVIYSITPTANSCIGSAITVQINVAPKPVTSFVADTTYCNGETTSITLSSTIPGTTFTWNVASSNVNTTTVLPGSGNSISQALNLINNSNVGSVTYTVLPFANNCYGDPVSIAIEVNPIPNVSLAIEDTDICSGEMVHIDASSSIAGATFNWMILNQTGAVVTGPTTGTGASIDQVITTTSPVASGTVTYQVTPIKNGCVGSSSTVTVTVHPRPEIFGVLPQLPICSGESTNIVLAASLPGTTFNWVVSNSQGVSGMSAGTGTSITQVLTTTGSTQGSVTYAVTPMLNGCEGTMVEYTVLVNPLPIVSLEDGHVCVIQATGVVYQTYLLESGVPPTGYTFDWYLDGVQLASSGPNHVATAPGVYEVRVRNTVTNCQAIATATVIPVYPATAFTTTVTEAFTNNATITVTVTQPGTGTLVYALDGGAWQTSNIFEGVEAGMHTVAVGDEEGCTYLETNVLVIDYMKYFTPNGDGYNDTWNIIGLNAQHNAKIYIFDRYGKLIKQLDPLGQGWDGTYNGQTLPSTDYWFTVDYTENQQQKQFRAHFSLKR
ncbi:PKD-like domain-containing protein [Flavobacterium sp. 20NA77.7]|uniref:PKD-like domain-containing protein n=1 Tax=Flavobacterium nakdongensis TaxID=3073563 RepID=A0ABY9R7K7_9FLAO|nr:PKD-like domain-containing protein [Flavobacterium sp. 20NA77.7]WMW77256.1 PKD-like domain-containing protein [Flavobacterium sp. 20NA77.7]